MTSMELAYKTSEALTQTRTERYVFSPRGKVCSWRAFNVKF